MALDEFTALLIAEIPNVLSLLRGINSKSPVTSAIIQKLPLLS
jgi:hypothetical protein